MAANDIVVPRENAQGQFEELVLPDATPSARGLLSSSDKTKLDSVASGAEVNVNADWNASSGDAQILNKPSTFAPTAHAASHASAGSDPVTLDPSQVVSVNGFGGVWGGGESLTDVFANAGNLFYLNQEDVAAASHAHGNLTSDGKIGSTAGLPVVTTTAGAVTTLALGTAGQVLTVNSGATGVEFAAASGGGGEVRFDTSGSYTYTGLADAGASESSAVWFIRRSEFSSAGSYVGTTTANNVEWDDRLTASYS